MIVKVQWPLFANTENPPIFVKSEDGSIGDFIPITQELFEAMGGIGPYTGQKPPLVRRYFRAVRTDFPSGSFICAAGNVILKEPVKDQGW